MFQDVCAPVHKVSPKKTWFDGSSMEEHELPKDFFGLCFSFYCNFFLYICNSMADGRSA